MEIAINTNLDSRNRNLFGSITILQRQKLKAIIELIKSYSLDSETCLRKQALGQSLETGFRDQIFCLK